MLLQNPWRPGDSHCSGQLPDADLAILPSPHPDEAEDPHPLTEWSERPYQSDVQVEPLESSDYLPEYLDPSTDCEEIDPMYVFARFMHWERKRDLTAAWDLIAAAQSANQNTRAHARALLASSAHFLPKSTTRSCSCSQRNKMQPRPENAEVKTPYGLAIIESCAECSCTQPSFFCSFSQPVLGALEEVSQRNTYPAGAILFVEGQMPRGIYFLCSGRVRLSTTSHGGKILVLKHANSGEALGLSAAISGQGYEVTAETSTPCQVNFIDRKRFSHLLNSYSEVGNRVAQFLSRDFQAACRDIHDLFLSRSAAGKLIRLLLSCTLDFPNLDEVRVQNPMTHEEMAQRIGSSRETVTRLLSELRRKELIRFEGSTLVIRNRSELEALAV